MTERITERLYYADSHLVEFDARIISVEPLADGRAGIRLDRTAFYPTGGGQPADTGTLDTVRVVECIETAEGGVLHLVEGEAPRQDTVVHCTIDWPRRLDHIQQHTGQHILSQAFVALYQAQTRSFRMTEEACEVDVDLADPTDEKIERAVNHANEIIWDDREVRIHNLTPEEAAHLPLRKDSAREGELRVIEIAGFDFSPCGGTHARRTGEVGIVAARHWERAKGLVRVTFAAGVRALEDYRRANQAAREAGALLSAGRDEIAAAIVRLQDENKRQLRRIHALEEIAARSEARELLAEAESFERDGKAFRLVARIVNERDAEGLRSLAYAVVNQAQTIALLGSRDGQDVRLVFARSADAPGDMNALMRAACTMLEGRGGGRPDIAQGGGRMSERLDEAITEAARRLRLAT